MLGDVGLLGVTGGLLFGGLGAEVVILSSETGGGDGTSGLAVLAFRDVDLRGSVVGGRAVDCIEFPIVGPVLDVEMGTYVAVVRLLIVVTGLSVLGLKLELGAFVLLAWSLLLMLRLVLVVNVSLRKDVRFGLRWLLRLLCSIAVLFVDMDLFAGSRTAETVFLVDSDLFLVLNVAVVCGFLVDGGREGFVMLFVTFPSDLRSLF